MKNNLLFLFFGIILCVKYFVKSQDNGIAFRHIIPETNVRKFHYILLSVETNSFYINIIDENISLILPGAFEKTNVTQSLQLSFVKGPLTIGPESFKGLHELKYLWFPSHKSKITLNDDTFLFMPELISLMITLDEATTTLSKKFNTLNKLVHLKIIGGHLEIIKNDTFINNHNLEWLEISSCSIFSIEPRTFANLKNLDILDLRNNSLMRIESSFFDGLDSLKNLWLGLNNIYKIPSAILQDHNMMKFQLFYLSNNDLIEITLDEFLYKPQLWNIQLQNNRIKIVKRRLLKYQSSINQSLVIDIHLQNNYIEHIDEGTFAGLNLHILNISNNKLEFIQSKIFQGCFRIETLDLSRNNISKISQNTFKNCNITKIILSGNPLKLPNDPKKFLGLFPTTDIEWN